MDAPPLQLPPPKNDISSPNLHQHQHHHHQHIFFNHAMNPNAAINAQSSPTHLSIPHVPTAATPLNNNNNTIITSGMSSSPASQDVPGAPQRSFDGRAQLIIPRYGHANADADADASAPSGRHNPPASAIQLPFPPSASPNPPNTSSGLGGGSGGSGGLLPFEETFFTSTCRLAPPAPRSNTVAALVESPSFTQSPVTPLLFSSTAARCDHPNAQLSQVTQVHQVHPHISHVSHVSNAPPQGLTSHHLFTSTSDSAGIESPVSQHVDPAPPKLDSHGLNAFNGFNAFSPSSSAPVAGSSFMTRNPSSSSAYPTPYSPLPLPLPHTNSYNNVLGPTALNRLPLPPPPPPTTSANTLTNTFRSGGYASNAPNNMNSNSNTHSNINMAMIPVRKRPVAPCDDVANVLLPFTSSTGGNGGVGGTTVRFENASPHIEGHGHISRETLPSPPPPLPPSRGLAISPSPHASHEEIGVRYKTPIERLPTVENGRRIGEENLSRCRSLPWYLKETERRIQRTLGLAGEMWQGPSTNDNGDTQRVENIQRTRYRYPRGEDDVDTLLDEATVLEQSWYLRLKYALSEQLDEIRASAIMCEDIMENHLNMQRRYRSIPIEEVDRRMEYCRAKFLKCRLAILEKFKTFVRALKWVHLSPQRVRRGSYTREQNNALRLWLFTHFNDPYPTAQEKARLMQQCRMNDTQISNWFINSRVRIWKPCLNAVSQSQAATETVRQLEENREMRRQEQRRAKRRRSTPAPTPTPNMAIVSRIDTANGAANDDGSVPTRSLGESSSSGTTGRKDEMGEVTRRC